MKPTILMAPRLLSPLLGRILEDQFAVLGPLDPITPANLPAGSHDVEALITIGGVRTDAALIAALPRLRLIHCYGTGYEGVDRAAASARGILVTNAGVANAEAVAEFAMGLVICAARRILEGDNYIRSGKWKGHAMEELLRPPGLFGRRIGIYGLGQIGRRIAARAAAFGMEVGYHNRQPSEAPYLYHESVVALADWSNVLIVAVRASAQNRHIVDSSVLRALGSEGILVNISRGSVVDTDALCDALESNLIAGAALDVFEEEPTVPERLLVNRNVVLTPHIAAFAASAQRAQQTLALHNLQALFAGRPLANLVG
ncbi:2-hydroxyacid dehydrogenase [Bradyrhizobium manausense]|uniref:NAD(P)-dependent oxidoreductase n=1 Tax=Bradyrhizobium manausense TaxID=989370 RepID=UPI001BA47167|nr:NAD(P)-dependent oxidoreductase [Bradyrhizobium manausense]MBR0828641.1 2-hydroxyacid dehydrogenase [Bradyrhizobium manausense]